jgi:gamma-glutamylcyclotransferase (GGCT)/AIG2-like uncharacterized protein YtfP
MDRPRLFAYGTLQPGRLRWPFLEPFAAGHRAAAVPGRLYDSGYGWPVATFDADEADVVPGTLVELDVARADEALDVLDEVEATATDLLVRIAVTTTDATPAWTYHCPSPEPGMVRIARWDRLDER